MIYVALLSVAQAIERVRQRKSMGGHDVPEDKIRSRWQRSLDNLGHFTPLVDRLMVFSNASAQGNAVLVARKREGVVEVLDPDALPELTELLLRLSAKP